MFRAGERCRSARAGLGYGSSTVAMRFGVIADAIAAGFAGLYRVMPLLGGDLKAIEAGFVHKSLD